MSASKPTILVIGAAGRAGGLVAAALTRRGATVRALLRHPNTAGAARANGATEIAIGDLRDPGSVLEAAKGAHGVFHVGPAFVPDEAEVGVTMVEAAQRSGVRKLVFSSVIHATNGGLANHASKLPVETAIFRSRMEYTILYPATFFQNIAPAWDAIVSAGLFAEPFPKDVKLARVDYRDVADVAAEALTTDRLAYGSFELCSDEMLSRTDITRIMSEVLGRSIAAAEPSFAEWATAARLPYDDRQKKLLANVFRSYAEHGSAGNSLTLRAILGREPRTLRRYIEELAALHSHEHAILPHEQAVLS